MSPTMDVFNADAFASVSLTAAVEKVPHLPTMLGEMNLFEPVPVRTTSVMIEERTGALHVIPIDARGAPPKQRTNELRAARSFGTVRIAESDKIWAHEIQNIRAFGSETEFVQVQAEVARRGVGPTGIRRNIELTWENMRLGAIQGIVYDADRTTVIYDWFTEFGITQDDEIDFDLDNPNPDSGAVRMLCAQIVRQTARASQGAWLPTTQVHSLCGDTFWDQLIAHEEVRQTFLNWNAAADLRGSAAWTEAFYYGGIYWHNYRGTDDGSTVAVATTKAKFFPLGAPGVFQTAWGPGESFEWVNTLGRPEYMMVVPDRDRNQWVQVEMYSYPLFYCTRPKMLQRARNT